MEASGKIPPIPPVSSPTLTLDPAQNRLIHKEYGLSIERTNYPPACRQTPASKKPRPRNGRILANPANPRKQSHCRDLAPPRHPNGGLPSQTQSHPGNVEVSNGDWNPLHDPGGSNRTGPLSRRSPAQGVLPQSQSCSVYPQRPQDDLRVVLGWRGGGGLIPSWGEEPRARLIVTPQIMSCDNSDK